jgi:hypothetical protein
MASNASKGRRLWCVVMLAHVYKFQLIQTGECFVADRTREPVNHKSKTTTVNVRCAAVGYRQLRANLHFTLWMCIMNDSSKVTIEQRRARLYFWWKWKDVISPPHMYTSMPSPASTFPGQASHTFYPETSSHNDPSYQEEPNSVLPQAISSIGGLTLWPRSFFFFNFCTSCI